MMALFAAGVGLALGLASRRADWVSLGVSLVLLLPPLRIVTSVIGEMHARRFKIAVMGIVVLMVLFFSRRISRALKRSAARPEDKFYRHSVEKLRTPRPGAGRITEKSQEFSTVGAKI